MPTELSPTLHLRLLGPFAASHLTSPTTHTLALQLTEEECDLLAFNKAQEQNRPEAWRQAVTLYRGHLLADSYELWVRPERAARHEGYLHTLQRLAQYESEQGEWREAAHFLRLGIACDLLRESLYGALMEAQRWRKWNRQTIIAPQFRLG